MLRLICTLVLLLPSVSLLHADEPAPAPLLTNVDGRKTTSFDGDWHYVVDPYDSGYLNYRSKPRDDGYFHNANPETSSSLVEYNFAKSPTLKVPGDWNSQDPRLFFYEGTVWYQRDFSFTRHPDTKVFLYIGAANYQSRVWVNGSEACEHTGGFTSFNCDVTNLLHDGSNFAVIYVNNARHRDAVPTTNTDWWNYGGLTRDVMLVEVPNTFVQDYSFQLQRGAGDRIEGSVKVQGGAQDVTVRIPDLQIDQHAQAGADGVAHFDLAPRNLQRWSPENPKLYDVEVRAGNDSLHERIGFRTVEVRGQDILLNGKPIFLRGVSIHEEAPIRSGRAYSEENDRTLLTWAKQLGCNYVRLAHYPHNRRMTRLADEMGLLVWSEIPVYWTIEWTNPATMANAKAQLTEEITRERNRAAIAIWSVGNETPVSPERMAFMRELVHTARELDSSRLISAALETHYSQPDVKLIDDPLGAELDVLGCNEYVGWYERKPEDADRITWQSVYTKPLIMSEFGGDAKAGLHGPANERWTEEYQESIYQHQVVMLKKISFLRGTTPWILMDFRSPRRQLPGIQDYYNRKGLVSDKGEKKKAYFVLQKWYGEIAGRQ